MGLGSYFELCQIFQRFPNSAYQHLGKCDLLSESSGYFANPAQDFLFHLSSLFRAFPVPTLRNCLEGFVYFSSCYRYRAYFSTDSESSRTPQLTLWSKPLPYNTVSLRLVSCYWLGLKTIKANIIK